MKLFIDWLNSSPAPRWLVGMIVLVVTSATCTWTVASYLGAIETRLAGIETTQSALVPEVKQNTEFRLRSEGLVKK